MGLRSLLKVKPLLCRRYIISPTLETGTDRRVRNDESLIFILEPCIPYAGRGTVFAVPRPQVEDQGNRSGEASLCRSYILGI
jgi:hypothetical protein